MDEKYPTLFLGHGAPPLSLEENATTLFFAQWPRQFPRPRAIVVVSAHWETGDRLRVTAWDHRPVIHDFQGFPQALYRLDYPAPGSVAVANEIRDAVGEAGFGAVTLDEARGLDHGCWVPLRFMFPRADVPVLQLSLASALGAERLYGLGRALSPLRDEGILLIASGAAVHNLRSVAWDGNGTVRDWARVFEEWLRENLGSWNTRDLFDYWRMAPHGVQAHPSEEHLLPLFVAMGSADSARTARVVHDGFMYGSLSMLAVEFS